MDEELIKYSELKINNSAYKSRYLIKKGDKYLILKVNQIAYFIYEYKILHVVTFDNKQYVLDNRSLDKIEQEIDSSNFFRVNRKCIVNINSFEYYVPYTNGRLNIKLKNNLSCKIQISKNKSYLFKKWLDL